MMILILMFQILAVVYLSTRIGYTLNLTVREWRETREEEPEIHDQSTWKKFTSFWYLFWAMWFFIPLNLIASMKYREEDKETEEHQ